jgi:glycine betaine/proline transport system ATP-binding protein
MASLISVTSVSKVFGGDAARAIKAIDERADKATVFKQTGAVVGLHGISFDVAEGEILIVMGLSGCGKSTMLRCLNRLIDPSAGSILIGGQDITKLTAEELPFFRRKRFGMVFQNFALLPYRTILGNAAYGLELQGAAKPEREVKAREALALVGLAGWEDKLPHELSGGMQQRAGLARALAVDPQILLMDEAFSALDPLIRRGMQNELRQLQDRLKKTIVFVSHDLDEAIALGGRIVLMKDGSIVQIGKPEEIVLKPADDYVRRFVEHVDVASVITLQSMMEAGPSAGAPMPLTATLREALPVLAANETGVMVTNREGRPVGHVTRRRALALLAERAR